MLRTIGSSPALRFWQGRSEETGSLSGIVSHAPLVGMEGQGNGYDKVQTILPACSKLRRGPRGNSFSGSPYPMLQRKFDFQDVPLKKASSTLALSKPDIGPMSSPSARAASIRKA